MRRSENNFISVILAGGRGERFWPLSRSSRPKQFLRLLPGGQSLLEATVERLLPLSGWERTLVATSQELAPLIKDHLPDLPEENLILEPAARDTAPAAAWASLHVERRFGDDVPMGFFPADHFIVNNAVFKSAVSLAARIAREHSAIVTLGVSPTYPSSAFGYIERGEPLGNYGSAYRVRRFVEKPDRSQAERYLVQGGFYWNAGIFIFRPRVLLDEFQRHAPDILNALENEGSGAYENLRKVSLDYAVMEHTDKAIIVPAEFEWDDLGDWTSLERLLEGEGKNVELARHIGIDTEGAIIYATSRDEVIVTLGVKNVVIVRDGNITLVVRKDRVQEIKRLLTLLKEREYQELL